MADEIKVKTFEQAKQELDKILNEFDRDAVTLDNLVPLMKRAKELIDFCTKRIKQVETEAKEIVRSIEPKDAEAAEHESGDEAPF